MCQSKYCIGLYLCCKIFLLKNLLFHHSQDGDHLVLDMPVYKDASMLHNMFIEKLRVGGRWGHRSSPWVIYACLTDFIANSLCYCF